ncbi:hypothetical protein JoomaDRAFT_1226 [Galbibacter orientalis DSM 19592]|uniref:Uncharacterized protein n=1 Tax=Galbibacter orientalis DSM 19592 TaxID=926559 RepID=I3C3Q1_9FLAO|nr:hypothetical protein [Galbibacter orientalis]EIJ38244.1 hypothetical protein JoomaDRAFT_1226 [Galbibacter orientalis DSM 19592]
MKNPYEELVKRVFDKAKSKGGSKTKNGQATHLSTIFTEDYKHPISVRTFTTIYNFYLLKDTSRSVTLKIELLDLMAHYVGDSNYEDFIKKNAEDGAKVALDSPKNKFNGERILLIILGIMLLLGLSYSIFFKSEPKCMSWKEFQYEIVSCNISETETTNEIIIYDVTVYKKLKKIHIKEVKIGKTYYCKMEDGTIEYFSYFGKHPVTKEHLKPVTPYMYNKYVEPSL